VTGAIASSVENRRRSTWIAGSLLLVLIASARIVSTYTIFNHTIDEPDHLAAGMEWLTVGKYRYEDQHPPLARVFGALGPYLLGARWSTRNPSQFEGYRILGRGVHYTTLLAAGRAGILPFFWLGAAVVFLWGLRLSDARGGFTGVLVYSTIPAILGHSGLITTDVAAASLCGAACLAYLHWVDRPTTRRSILLGVAISLAFLAKFSTLAFIPASCLLMMIVSPFRRGITDDKVSRVRLVGMACGVAFIVIWLGYLFTFGPVGFLHLRLPAQHFFSGIYTVWKHNSAGHDSYLMGRRSPTGFWYYYPIVLAIKTPIGIIVLSVLALLAVARKRGLSEPLAFVAAVVLVAMASRINIGIRHILPVYVGLSVACGVYVSSVFQSRFAKLKWLVASLVAWSVISGMFCHPDYLAYTNEFTGTHPEQFVADSDLDWGQDMKRLATYLRTIGSPPLTFSPFNRTYGCDGPACAGDQAVKYLEADKFKPSGGWNAVSITLWKVHGFPAWPDMMKPHQKIGASTLLWHFPDSRGTPK
jgi:hypothetical protein